jgi:hypothetical protein
MSEPVAARAHLPPGYGLPPDSALLSWSEVDTKLRDAPHYWIATVGDDAVPVVRPIDGMWLDGPSTSVATGPLGGGATST